MYFLDASQGVIGGYLDVSENGGENEKVSSVFGCHSASSFVRIHNILLC